MRTRLQHRLRLLSRIESLGGRVTRSVSKAFVGAALRGLSTGRVEPDIDAIVEELVDLMMLGYVKRYELEKQELHLSFESDVRKKARQLDLDEGAIRRSFVGRARRAVSDAAGSIAIRINTELGKITAAQTTTRQATRQLRRRIDEMGLTPRNPSLVETLVRTHAQIAFSAAQVKLDREDPLNLITGWQYVTVGDDRVREEHAELDGLIRPKDDPIWDTIYPPNGYNCRCQVLTLIDGEDFTDAPANATGLVDEAFRFNPGELT